MSDDNDKKSDAALKFVKSKDLTKKDKNEQRPDVQIRNARNGNNGMGSGCKPKNCGCNQPCNCGRGCGCIHNCIMNTKRRFSSYYNPRMNCNNNWLSDYTGAQFSESSSCNTDCTGGYSHWNTSGIDLTTPCNTLCDSGDHITHQLKSTNVIPQMSSTLLSYLGTSPYFDGYERARAKKRVNHMVQDGVYF
jgi:hypothetical protein